MSRIPAPDPAWIRATLEQMIRIPSILPHEESLSNFVAEELRAMGVEPEWQEVEKGRPNVYAVAQLGPDDRLLTLTGHLDTVGVAEGWETDPFEPVQRGDRLHGLGALDMKSGVACAMGAFRAILGAEDLHRRLGRVAFAATVDEEGLGAGARGILETEIGASAAMVLAEPYSGQRAGDPAPAALTGKVLYRIALKGRATHALENPERGVNAVEDAARLVVALDRLALGTHPEMGRASYSTLKISGGYSTYAVVVPERCEVIVSRLLVPGEDRASALEDMRRLISSLGLESEATVEVVPPYYEPYELDEESGLFRGFRSSFKEVFGREPLTHGKRAITDGNIFVAEGGIPTVTCGPAGSGLHEAGEYVELSSLDPVARVFVGTTLRFFGAA